MSSPLLLLHGANGSAATMQPLADPLRARVTAPVLALDLLGHGGRPLPQRFGVEDFAADILAAMDRAGIDRATLLGYSFGGYVALYLARHHPQRLAGVCTLATKLRFDAATVQHFVHLADPERLSRPGNPRAAQLAQDHHPQDWRRVSENNRALFAALGERPALRDEDLCAISVPALVISGELDQLVTPQETREIAKLIPGSEIATFKGFGHPLAAVPLDRVAWLVGEWLKLLERRGAAG
jgi:pimeloyl-ACP methyl ester carboxylesterase